MLFKWRNYLNLKTVILGSESIQRKNILEEMGLKFQCISSNFPENLPKTDPEKYVSETCFNKFTTIINDNPDKTIDFLITADSIVVLNNKILEKADSEEEAFSWILSYSGKIVEVMTACCFGIIKKNNKGENYIKDHVLFVEKTNVKMIEITDEIAKNYIDLGEWKGRAGAIGVHLFGKILVEKYDGCHYNCVGFPISAFSKNLNYLMEKNKNLLNN
jgi:septum formation protein